MNVLSLAEFDEALASESLPPDSAWRPVFCALDANERAQLRVMAEREHIRVVDTIGRQLSERAQLEFPSPNDLAPRERFLIERYQLSGDVRTANTDAIGCWAYFSWMRTIVHLLPANDYFAVITNRNHDKITVQEQILLAGKRVGVLGLSVGGEAAVTVAQEHLCGEIVIADFDALDLTNLNRLQAGVDEIGDNKSHIVARRIARINPYLKVTTFEQGVTASSISQFMSGLDLLLEECDGLAIKYAIREEAKRQGVNVVYAADERGFLSVEPYALLPELAVFHGRINAPPLAREEYPSTLAFFTALAEWIGGWDSLSERSRESLLAINTRLCGYPQLASEARFAAGMVGHVARLLLLGVRLPASVRYVDLDEMLR